MDGLLGYPQYTRPEEISGRSVPAPLLSGDHARVRRWRLKQALGRTWLRRPDLLEARRLSDAEMRLLEEYRKAKQVTRTRLYVDAMARILSNTKIVILSDEDDSASSRITIVEQPGG